MNTLMNWLIYILFLLPVTILAQSQEDFQNKYTSVFMNMQDSVKAKELALEAYEMVENQEDLQTMSNYYMLRAAFDAVGDDAHVQECEKKAKALMEFPTTIEKPETYHNPGMEWAYEYQNLFYTSDDPGLGKKALKFLDEHPELTNFTRLSGLAYYFDRTVDFENAGKYYALALDKIDYANSEFVSLIQPAFFYMKSGEYEKVDELLGLNEQLLNSAGQYTRAGYESSRDMIQMYYYLYIGDYHHYIQSANTYYDLQYEQNKANLIGNPYQSLKELNKAIGYEYLREYDLAEQHYQQYEQAAEEQLNAMKETYPNYQQENFPILDIYRAKRGNLNELEIRITKLDNYYQYIEQYASPTFAQQYQKAVQYALYRDQKYSVLFDEALSRLEDVQDFNEATGPYAQYAYFLMRDNKLDAAHQMYDRLFDENLEWINDLIFTFGEKAFVAYFSTKLKEGYDNYHTFVKRTRDTDESLHRKLAGNAFNNLLLTKSIAFKGARKRKQAFRKANDPQVIALYDEWLTKKQQLIRMYQMAQQDNRELSEALNIGQDLAMHGIVSKDQLDALQTEVDQIENRLAGSAKGFKEQLEIEQPRWQKVRASLEPGEAAIEMVRFHWRDQIYYVDTAYYAAYILRHDSDYPEVVYLPALANDLDTRFYKLYQNSIQLKIKDNTSYDQFWQPLKSKLEDINRVYFSPDGIFHLINLPTLYNPKSGNYLLDEIEILNVTSTGDLTDSKQANSFTEAVLVGRPAYAITASGVSPESLNTRSFRKDFRNANITDLPGTEDEVLAITNSLRAEGVQVKQLLGSEATEGELYALQAPDVLHIATHGFWSGTDNATDGYRMFNAMMNSGLLMAGVVDYYSAETLEESNDGILTAYEAQHLDLEGAGLVVLSACETGLGDFDAGEGVYGLQRAFRAAGTSNIVTTLWKIDDQATKDFMVRFYQQIVQQKDIQIAFRIAMLKMKEAYSDPYYWGAFVLTR
ncbi:MAG: CHAT domain-containing protein [Bacteroidota bacterium]